MTKHVGISRTHRSLNSALEKIGFIQAELNELNQTFSVEKYELENALLVAKLVAEAALKRKNSIGAHYRADYPHIALENKEGQLSYDKVLA